MKSFAVALLAATTSASILGGSKSIGLKGGYGASAGYGAAAGYGGYTKVDYVPHTKVVQPAKSAEAASKGYGSDYSKKTTTDWDAWGRDQDLAIDESYGRTNAKSYRAESYDEWDNQDDDQWGGQGWGRDYDYSGKSSKEYDASADAQKGKKLATDVASWDGAAQTAGYDNDAWAKQAYGKDYDNRWGKSYDSVEARNYANEHYAREVRADDDQWAEDRDGVYKGDYDQYGRAASAQKSTGHSLDRSAASKGQGSNYWAGTANDWDAWGRDQDFHEKVSYDDTWAKSYAAESYDEWDNRDADKWGGQAWGKDKDIYGASSYGRKASSKKVTNDKYGKAYGAGGHGHGYGKGYGAQYGTASSTWAGASAAETASQAGYDNDSWAKQAYGQDQDARWGKSYDSVSARSYDNKKYARWLQADDDQWAEDYDSRIEGDANQYGKAASIWTKQQGKGWAKGPIGGHADAASRAGAAHYDDMTGSDWDAYGRDQDLEVDESYEQTWAKSYDAESYDEWDNLDKDKWGGQAWGRDLDIIGASSYGARASAGDKDKKAYGGQYGAGYGYAQSYGKGYGHSAHGAVGAKGGWGGKGVAAGYGKGGYGYQGGAAYGAVSQQKAYGGKSSAADYQASAGAAAAVSGTDADAWAKQAYGSDYDSRWGKSYDFVNANEYDDEQYARKVRADDDQWAEDYDVWSVRDTNAYGAAASKETAQPKVTKTTYSPVVSHKSYGYGRGYGGYGATGGYGAGYGSGYKW